MSILIDSNGRPVFLSGGALVRPSVGGGGGGARDLLTSSDIDYLGLFVPPTDNDADIRFAYGLAIPAIRRVGSDIRIFLTGGVIPSFQADPIYEIVYPGSQALSGTYPRATMARKWLTAPYKNAGTDLRRGVWSATSQYSPETRGLLYYDNKLWWSQGHYYNTAGHHDPTIGFAELDDETGVATGYGTWRTTEHTQRTKGYLLEIPQDFADAYTNGKRLAVGAPITSGNGNSPWGPMLAVMDTLPTTATPASGYVSGSTDVAIPNTKFLAKTTNAQRMQRSQYLRCGWTEPDPLSPQYNCANGSFIQPETGFSSLDTMTGAVWIRTATKEGVFMIGQQVAPAATDAHTWYGPGNSETGGVCCHGKNDPYQGGTGDQTNLMDATAWIFDPATLAQAAQGLINPWDVTPAEEIRMRSTFGTNFPAHARQYWSGGCVYDATSRLLFVTHKQAGVESGGTEVPQRPVIHVFQVAD